MLGRHAALLRARGLRVQSSSQESTAARADHLHLAERPLRHWRLFLVPRVLQARC